MNRVVNRRDMIFGSLAAGAALALPHRALAQTLEGAAEVPPLPTEPVMTADYERRLVEVAKRELERAGASVWRHDVVGVADFARGSSLPRLHFVNLEGGTVRSFLVAHGRGSDREHSGFLQKFSNVPGSEATSRGAYLTCEWYTGKYGTSIRLEGLDADNSNAHDRAIVMHRAWYASPEMIARQGKLGRSEGCFAMGPEDFNQALWNLSGGRLLFADRIGEA